MNTQQIPHDDLLLQMAFCSYRASDQTLALKSEKNRTIFAEYFENGSIPILSTLCLKEIAKNFGSQTFHNLKLKTTQLKTFYDFIDEDLPIEKSIMIDEEQYWKRVYSSKCKDKIFLKKKNQHKDVSWKSLALAQKYTDLIENMLYEFWVPEEMEIITKLLAPYVIELKISKLQAMREESFRREQEMSSESSMTTISEIDGQTKDSHSEKNSTSNNCEYNFPFEDCHHVDLSILGSLENLNSLTMEFVPPKLSSNYHNRFFNFSYVDIENLARGISKLINLQTFKLRRSRMNSVKLSLILEALKLIFVEKLEFFFCQLDDNCGKSLYEYIISTKTLTHLDLSGNYFKQKTIDYLSKVIQISPSKIYFLALCNNPISGESLCNLTKILETYEHLRVLKLSGIQSSETGASGIAKLVKNNSHLNELHIIAVQMNGTELIDSLEKNHTIQMILYQGCSLTLEEEFKVEVLLKRNRYIKENPYIGDLTKTEEEINTFKGRTKNDIFIKTLKDQKHRSNCLQHKLTRVQDIQKSNSEFE